MFARRQLHLLNFTQIRTLRRSAAVCLLNITWIQRAAWAGLVLLAAFSAMPAFGGTDTVTNAADSGAGSLRDTIAAASPGDTINFSLTLPATITLTSGELLISKNLMISGPGASSLAINGYSASRVFEIASGTVAISGLTIQNGSTDTGGGIMNSGTLTLTNSIISGNSASFRGGGIYNGGTLTMSDSTLSGNSATGSNPLVAGGGIFNVGTLTVTNSTLSANSALLYGGGINSNSPGTVALTNSTLFGNSAGFQGGGISSDGSVTISNSTLTGNSSPQGGSINNFGPLTVKNSLLANSASGGNCYFGSGPWTVTSEGYNLSDDSTCSSFFTQTGDLNSTPAGLDPNGLQSNGGFTRTIALLATSPAVEAIPLSPTNYCTDVNSAPVATDQRGVTRPQQGPACDIGAFELGADNDSQFSQLNGGNTFNGNQNVNGNVMAANFVGSGAGLTNVVAASAGTANFATTAGDSLMLGGFAAGNYARLDVGNAFNGNQTITSGNQTITGGILALDNTNGTGTKGVITLGGNPFIDNFGAANTFVGQNAGNFTMTGNSNTAGGYQALVSNTTGSVNTAGGADALYSNTTGYNNTAYGAAALYQNTTGYDNTASSLQALYSNTTGYWNTASGAAALYSNTTGIQNTAGSFDALWSNTTGSNNTALGFQAGLSTIVANGNTTGSNNTFIGFNSGPGVPSSANLQNATAIGSNAIVNASNALVLGSINGFNGATSSVNVGIGTATPGYALDVQGGQINTSGGLCIAGMCQTSWPGTLGTVTSVATGAGLTGGPITSTGTISVASGGITNALLANPSLTVTAGPGLTGGGSVSLGGATTVSLATNTCAAGSAVTAHPFTCSPFAGLGANIFTGNQTMPSLTVNGLITAQSGNFTNGLTASISSNLNPGIFGTNTSLNGVGILGEDNNGTSAIGVWGSSTNGFGVTGSSTNNYGVSGNSNFNAGVSGNSINSYGVLGTSSNNAGVSGTGNVGVFGTSNNGYGVVADSNTNVALAATTLGANAAAGWFTNTAGGSILLGQSGNPAVTKFSVDGNGDVAASGSVTIGGGTPILEHLSVTLGGPPNLSITIPSISPNNCATLGPITVTGASDGDTISLGVPNALIAGTAGDFIEFYGWVSAANAVTIRVCNPHGGSSNNQVSTGTGKVIRVDIWKH